MEEMTKVILAQHSLGDFYPFKSKVSALLYFMLHSHRPIVSALKRMHIDINIYTTQGGY